MSIFTETSPGIMLPVPADLAVNDLVAILFTVWAAATAVVILPWVIRVWVKNKDSTPFFMFIGGIICCTIEPMLDNLGHLWWPTDLPGPAFVGYSLNVPYLIVASYPGFLGMISYWAYTKMRDGLDVKAFFQIFLLLTATDLILEMPGTALGAFVYYGDQPFKVLGYPMAWTWINAMAMLTAGFMLWTVEPHLKGIKRAFIILIPVMGGSAGYAMSGWLFWLALNWEMPMFLAYFLTLVSLPITLVIVYFFAIVVEKSSVGRETAVASAVSPAVSPA